MPNLSSLPDLDAESMVALDELFAPYDLKASDIIEALSAVGLQVIAAGPVPEEDLPADEAGVDAVLDQSIDRHMPQQ